MNDSLVTKIFVCFNVGAVIFCAANIWGEWDLLVNRLIGAEEIDTIQSGQRMCFFWSADFASILGVQLNLPVEYRIWVACTPYSTPPA